MGKLGSVEERGTDPADREEARQLMITIRESCIVELLLFSSSAMIEPHHFPSLGAEGGALLDHQRRQTRFSILTVILLTATALPSSLLTHNG